MKTLLCFFASYHIAYFSITQVVTVYQDDFGSNCSGFSNGYTCANGVAPNNTGWYYGETQGGGTSGNQAYSINGNELRLINNFNSTSCPCSYGTAFVHKSLSSNSSVGTNGVYGTYTTSNPNHLNDEFTLNTTNIEWSFLVYLSQTPDGLSNGAQRYGGAFVLGSTGNQLTLCNTASRNRGYAVVFGNEFHGANQKIYLSRFESGTSSPCATNNYPQYMINTSFTTDNTTCLISDNVNMSGAKWYAVKVQYNPSNDQWRLFTRHNVSSTFDPTTLGPADGKGSQIDNTYTSLYLSYMGLYASLEDRNTATESVRLKRLKIRKNVSLIESPTTGLCGAITALPVEFDGMSMSCVEAGVNLNWITVSELNNDHFSIERSSDGVDFEKIADISGQGTSSQLSTYSWIDERPIMGTSYYRLSQTDYNGEKTALSTLSSVWPCTDLSAELTVYPNPTSGDVQLIFRQEGRHEYTVEVINSFGQIVLDHMTGLASGEGVTTIELNSQSLPLGVYSVHLKVGENIYSEKLVRQ